MMIKFVLLFLLITSAKAQIEHPIPDFIPEHMRDIMKRVMRFDHPDSIPDNYKYTIRITEDLTYEFQNGHISNDRFEESLYDFLKSKHPDGTIVLDYRSAMKNIEYSAMLESISVRMWSVILELYNEIAKREFHLEYRQLSPNQQRDMFQIFPIRIIDASIAILEHIGLDIDYDKVREPVDTTHMIHVMINDSNVKIDSLISSIDHFEMDLKAYIKSNFEVNTQEIVFSLGTTRESNYRRFISVFDILKKIGAKKISIADPDAE